MERHLLLILSGVAICIFVSLSINLFLQSLPNSEATFAKYSLDEYKEFPSPDVNINDKHYLIIIKKYLMMEH